MVINIINPFLKQNVVCFCDTSQARHLTPQLFIIGKKAYESLTTALLNFSSEALHYFRRSLKIKCHLLMQRKGDIPPDLLVPIPNQQFCEFKALEWGQLEESEKEAFKTFYTEVGADLEDAVLLLNQGVTIDELSWQRITQTLKA